MVAREGSAPSISGCRPDVILLGFPSLANQFPQETFASRIAITTGRIEARLARTGCRGWNRTSIRAFKGRCPTIRRPGNELVEPEVVATSPCPGKSRVPVCCGFDSLKLVLAAGVAPALTTFSTSCLCVGLREQMEWSLQPVMLRREFFTKEIRRLLRGGGN